MFRNILVPVDRSAFSENAISPAVAIARKSGGTLHFVTVNESIRPIAVRPASAVFEPALDALIERELREYVDEVAGTVHARHGVEATAVLLEGQVPRELGRYVKNAGIDLVVMTTHGHGGLRRAWLGSVADSLIRRLGVPLLLVRPADTVTPIEPIEMFTNVMVALDGSTVAETALQRVISLPFSADARCTLIRIAAAPILPSSPYIPDTARLNQEQMDARAKEAEEYLGRMAPVAGEFWSTVDERVVSAYRPAEALLEHAAQLKADLIVLGTHGEVIRRAVVGSVADKVIRGAEVPVFVVPSRVLAGNRPSRFEGGVFSAAM